ncbi:MAG TPA: hypothetical protein VN256_07310 [Pyrinomonadaceae bacterium]|nr:hypothetical protein [Pyrinomonadaceae bacterium]
MEATHKRVLRCAWCRYSLYSVPAKQQKVHAANPATYLTTKCWYCGTPYIITLKRTDEHYREAYDLIYNSHPIKRLTDERIHAAELWLPLAESEKEKYLKARAEEAERKNKTAPRQPGYQPTIRPNAKERKARAERDNLQARARAFVHEKQEEFKRRAGRTVPFPIDKTLEALEAGRCHSFDKELKEEAIALGLEESRQPFYNYTQRITTVRNSILRLRKREACEVAIWGAALPATLEEIAFFEALPSEVAAEALEGQREAQEKAAQEAAKRQCQHEEYLARSRGGAQQSSSVLSGMARPESQPAPEAQPSHSDLLKILMGESAYNAMRAAQGLANDRSSTDAQGHRSIEIPYIEPEQESQPPPDDGTIRYQQKLAHWRKTGVWPPDPWQRPGY